MGGTTLIPLLSGFIAPTEGQIELFGEISERGLRAARRRIGSIVETPALYPGITVMISSHILGELSLMPQ